MTNNDSIDQVWNITKSGYSYRDYEAEDKARRQEIENKAEAYANRMFDNKVDGRWMDRKWGYYDALMDLLNSEQSVQVSDTTTAK